MKSKKKTILYLLLLIIGSFFTTQACNDERVPIQLADATIMLSKEQLNAIPCLKGIQYSNPMLSVFNNIDSNSLFIILDLLQSKNNEKLYEKLKTFTGSQNPTDDLNNLWNLAEITEYLAIEIFNKKLSIKILQYLAPILINHYNEEDALKWLKEKEETIFFNALGFPLKKELATYYFHKPIKMKTTSLSNYSIRTKSKHNSFTQKRKLFISTITSDLIIISDKESLEVLEYKDVFTLNRDNTNHHLPIKKASLSSNNNFLITQSNDALVVTQIEENKQIARIPLSPSIPNNFLNKIDISPDNNYLISHSHNKVNIINLESKEVNIFPEQKKNDSDLSIKIEKAYLSKDSQFLITITSQNIIITYLKTKKVFKVLPSSAIVSTTLKTLSFVDDGNIELYLTDLSTIIANHCTIIEIYKSIKSQKSDPLNQRIFIDYFNNNFFAYYTESETSPQKDESNSTEFLKKFTEDISEETQESFFTYFSALNHASNPREKAKNFYLCFSYCLRKSLIKLTKTVFEDANDTNNPFYIELSNGIQDLSKEGELL